MKTKMTFGEWMAELKKLAIAEFGFSPDTDYCDDLSDNSPWRIYFDGGDTPMQAMIEDLSDAGL